MEKEKGLSSLVFYRKGSFYSVVMLFISIIVKGLFISQQLEQINIGEQLMSIDVSLLPKGNYFVELKSGSVKVVRKFLVQ